MSDLDLACRMPGSDDARDRAGHGLASSQEFNQIHEAQLRRRRQKVLDECALRQIEVQRVGQSYVLCGAGVDLQVADLASIDIKDLRPYLPYEKHRYRAE